jgi:tetratricopeptide (TPR) repeat protein
VWSWFTKVWSGNRFSGRDVAGIAVIGDVSGIVIQNIGHGPRPEQPSLPWRDLSPVGNPLGELAIFNLLTWRSRLAETLVGRDADRAGLIAWAADPRPIAIRLLTGPGGAGKSRLAAEVAACLRDENWSAGLISLGRGSSLPLASRGLFVVIDYPEAHRAAVATLLRGAAVLERPQAKIRLLLVSRQPLAWWLDEITAARASELCDSQESTVGPLDAAATCTLVRLAATRLSKLSGAASPILDETSISAWHARNPMLHGLPLFATAAAIHSVLDRDARFELAGEDIVRALVRRERIRLEQAGQSAGWGAEAASRLHGLAAVCDGLDAMAVRRLAARELEIGLPQPDRIVDAIRSQGWWVVDRLPAPSPDILAAELLYQILIDRPDRASDWLAVVLADRPSFRVERLGRLTHDMATLHGPTSNVLSHFLIQAIAHDPTKAALWREILYADEGRPFRLAALAAKVAWTLLEQPGLDETQRAALLNTLSGPLIEMGDTAGALTAIRESLEVYRRLAKANPDRFEPHLAGTLNTLSVALSDTGDTAGALAAIREAVDVNRRLAKADPERFERHLAGTLYNLSRHLGEIRDTEGALAAIRESVYLNRRLAKADPERFDPHLARSLNILSNALNDTGHRTDALAAIREAVDLYRRLAKANPARFELDLGSGLHNLSYRLSETGDAAGALAAIREAVDIRRRLAKANPTGFEHYLANSLNALSNTLGKTGDRAGAFAAINEAVDLYRRLAKANPARFQPGLAMSLNHLSGRLGDTGFGAPALGASREAVDLYRRLAKADPARFQPDLAQTLHNQEVLRKRFA